MCFVVVFDGDLSCYTMSLSYFMGCLLWFICTFVACCFCMFALDLLVLFDLDGFGCRYFVWFWFTAWVTRCVTVGWLFVLLWGVFAYLVLLFDLIRVCICI